MKIKKIEEKVEVPDGVDVRLEENTLVLKGQKGEDRRVFVSPTVNISIEGKTVFFKAPKATKREKMTIGTFTAHFKNMIRGVKEGHSYKMKICSGHFPMKVVLKGKKFVVENFLGEKIPRVLILKDDVKVKIDGNDILVESINKEIAGQCAASIETLTTIKGRDKRIFQDGIYITNKSGKEL